MAHVFISYVREDSKAVDLLAKELRRFGITVWLDRNDIAPGEKWQTAIASAIKEGSFFIACFSKHFVNKTKSFMNEELRIAVTEMRKMRPNRVWFIPLFLDETTVREISNFIDEAVLELQAVSVSGDWDDGIRKIVRRLGHEDEESSRINYLISKLDLRYEDERLQAIEQLSLIRPTRNVVVKALSKLLPESNFVIRNAALKALKRFGPDCSEAVSDLAMLINASDQVVRSEVINLLGQIDRSIVAKSLIQALKAPDSSLRRSAVNTIREVVPTSEVVPGLLTTTKDLDSSVRQSAVEALGSIYPLSAEIVSGIIAALTDADSSVRKTAAEISKKLILANIRSANCDPNINESILNALKDSKNDADLSVRLASIGSLEALGSMAAESLIRVFCDPDLTLRRRASDAVAKIGTQCTPLLIEALAHDDSFVRQTAAETLGQIDSCANGVDTALALVLNDSNIFVKRSAIIALRKVGARSSASVASLPIGLKDADDIVRLNTIKTIGNVGEKARKSIPSLTAIAGDKRDNLRLNALEALSLIGPNAISALPELQTCLEDENFDVRKSALKAIRAIKKKAIPALIKATENSDISIRIDAIKAIEGIGVFNDLVVNSLIKALSDVDNVVRMSSADALVSGGIAVIKSLEKVLLNSNEGNIIQILQIYSRIGSHVSLVLPTLINLLGHCDKNIIRNVSELIRNLNVNLEQFVPRISPLLLSTDVTIRKNALSMLSIDETTALKALPSLIFALEDIDDDIKKESTKILRHLNPYEMIPILINNIDNHDEAYVANTLKIIRDIGPSACDATHICTEKLQSKNISISDSAAQALSSIGGLGAYPLLRNLENVDRNKRREAARQLRKITLDASSVSIVMGSLIDNDPIVRELAADILGKLGPAAEMAASALTMALSDQDSAVRRSAAVAIKNIGRCAHISMDSLLNLLNDPDKSVRYKAAEAIRVVGINRKDCINDLVTIAVSNIDPEIRRQIVALLIDMKQGAFYCIMSKYDNSNEYERARILSFVWEFGGCSVSFLTAELMSINPIIRARSAESLGKLGLEAFGSLSTLSALLGDHNSVVRAHAEDAIDLICRKS